MIFLAAAMQLPLHDIVDEHNVSWWPLAIGWWLLLAGVVLGLVLFVLWWRRLRSQKQRNRSVDALLSAPASSISEINLRMKQVLMLKYPRGQFAHLSAEAWQQRVAAELPAVQREAFLQQLAPYLDIQYQTHKQATVDAYQTIAKQWWTMIRPRFNKEVRDV